MQIRSTRAQCLAAYFSNFSHSTGPVQRGRPRGVLGVTFAVGAALLTGCFEPAAPPEPGAEALVGAWEVVNGTRREACPDGAVSAPFEARVWFWGGDRGAGVGVGGAPIWRSDAGSACELRFGAWVDEVGAGAAILPGQACDEVVVEEAGTLGERRVYPVAWTVRQLPGDLLWESYELHVVERWGKVERVCRVSVAATLARAGAVIR